MINRYNSTLAIIFFQSIILFGQRELTVTEINSDNDAVIEIAGEDPTASDYTLMTLGFNQSNQAWLRTRTDHDLSFFTNDERRFRITNDGDFELRTRPLGIDGSRVTNLGFFTGGSNQRGSIRYCDCPADGGALMTFNMADDGFFLFRSNGETRMFLDRDNSARFGGLEGNETRALYVEEDGTLTSEASSFYINVASSQFQQNHFSTADGELEHLGFALSADFFFGQDGPVEAEADPIVPYTKYRITEIKIEYLDNSNESLKVSFDPGDLSLTTFNSSGQTSTIRTETLNTDLLIDNETTDGLRISVDFDDEQWMALYNIKLKCTPVN